MKKLVIYRAKPNPAGKDKFHNLPLASQLQGEFVDLMNICDGKLSLRGVCLNHTAFGANCSNPHNAFYWHDTEGLVLEVGAILRIHTGKFVDREQMAEEDRRGAHLHRWAEHGSFKLNNGACGESLTLWFNSEEIDRVGYDPYPPEGVVLIREGDKLAVPVRSHGMR